eukprot:2747787-Rhodomonas_salina.1
MSGACVRCAAAILNADVARASVRSELCAFLGACVLCMAIFFGMTMLIPGMGKNVSTYLPSPSFDACAR